MRRKLIVLIDHSANVSRWQVPVKWRGNQSTPRQLCESAGCPFLQHILGTSTGMDPVLGDALSVSSTSFQNIALSPRTPRSTVYRKFEADLDGLDEEDEDELTLLGEDDRRQYAQGLDAEDGFGQLKRVQPVSSEDKRAMALLCVLCMFSSCRCRRWAHTSADLIQGVPVCSSGSV